MDAPPGTRVVDGLVELTEDVSRSPLYNADLAPTKVAQRTWNKWHLASLWVGMSVCIPTYMLAAGLLAQGMSWGEAIFAIFLGNFIVLIPMVLLGHAGTRYGVPLPVFLRASFGSAGTHVPSVMRGLVACGWFGIQTWIGGKALYVLAAALWPGLARTPHLGAFIGLNLAELGCFFLFWTMNVWFVVRGTESIKWLETLSAPLLIAIGLALLVWGIAAGGGLSRILRHSDNFARQGVTVTVERGELRFAFDPVVIDGRPREIASYRYAAARAELDAAPWHDAPKVGDTPDAGAPKVWLQTRGVDGATSAPIEVAVARGASGTGAGGALSGWFAFLAILTAMVGYWATLSLNIPDFTRYARSQADQTLGQAMGLPTTMTLYSFIGVAVTCAALVAFPDVHLAQQAPWDPVALLARFDSPFIVVLSMIFLTVATLTTNIAANVVAPANAFSNLAPRAVSFKAGGLITAAIGVLMMPWKLVERPDTYIFTWLIGYSALLGPIAGILIADYFVVRRARLDLPRLYRASGADAGTIAVLALAVLPNVPGFLAQIGLADPGPFWKNLFAFAWFVGFLIAFVLYTGYGLWRRTRTT